MYVASMVALCLRRLKEKQRFPMLPVAIFCIVCAAWWLWHRKNVHTAEPPCFPGAWPIVGHVSLFLGGQCKLWDTLNDIAKQIYDSGGAMTLKFGPSTVYALTDPDDIHTVATTCLEKTSYFDFGRRWLGDGLGSARYSTWRIHRKLLNPAFNQSLLDTFMGVFNTMSRKLVKDLEEEVGKGRFNHWTYIKHNTLETICLTSLGVDFTDSNLNSDYVHALELIFDTLLQRFIKFWWHSDYTYAWSNLKKQEDACLKILHNMSNTVLQNRKSKFYGNTNTERNIPETKFKPFIDLLLELSLEKGAFTDKQIREHVDTMLVAGTDTSATVLMYTMVLLGSHPEAQEKVFAEIQNVLGEDRDVEKTDLSKLVYLEAVLKESMRFYPIAAVLPRQSHKDVKLKNYTLLAGRTVMLFLFDVHKQPIWGPDAHEFCPERWLDPGRLPDNPNAYAAFSLGRRNCIGKVYAMMSMKTLMAHVVRRYRITADHTKMRLKFDSMLVPDSGYEISIEKRT